MRLASRLVFLLIFLLGVAVGSSSHSAVFRFFAPAEAAMPSTSQPQPVNTLLPIPVSCSEKCTKYIPGDVNSPENGIVLMPTIDGGNIQGDLISGTRTKDGVPLHFTVISFKEGSNASNQDLTESVYLPDPGYALPSGYALSICPDLNGKHNWCPLPKKVLATLRGPGMKK
jgi:hypothetical protein